jgi:alpha-N-arabinofuranosidase
MLSLVLALILSVTANSNKPLVQNPGFESSSFLSGWEIEAHSEKQNGRAPTFLADRNDRKEGGQSLVIEAPDPSRAAVSQKIFLPVGSLWQAKAWVKTEGLSSGDQTRADEFFRDQPPTGAFIDIETLAGNVGTSAGSLGTTPWHEEATTFRVPSPGFINLTLVGTYLGTGKVWFDGVRLEPLPTATREDVRIFAEHTTKRPIDAMQQGQFIEILCNLIPSIIAQQVVSTSFEEAPPYNVAYKKEIDEPYRPWYPDGAVEVAQYSLDTTNPFNGGRSERIELPVEHARAGISQDGFYLKEGVSYKLRLHMRSEGNVRVRASLHSGGRVIAGPVLLGRAADKWTAAEADLRATRTSDNATLTIDFEGPGTLWLDRVYLIGSDAVLGLWRPDVVAALKAMHPGVIRFGGSTVENYEWRDGIGPWDQRQPFTTVWGGLEENFVGDDEFIQLCQHVGAEPLICVRWKNRNPEDAAAEVEYCNGSVETRWGKLRAHNGHPQPYGVKYWQIGNEVDAPEYNTSVRAFAEAMKRADPTIKLISSFPTKGLLAAAGTAFDYLAPHHYEIGDLTAEDRDFTRLQDWIAHEGGGKDIRVAVTEWNTTGGAWGLPRGILQTLGNALSVSRYLNLLQRNADLVEIANRSNFADSFGSGFVLSGPGWIYKSPAYYAQQLYARAAGTYPLRMERSSPLAWQLREPDLSASLRSDGKTLLIYAVNSTLEAVSTTIHLDGFRASVRGGTVHTLDDREHAMTSEVMNSRDDPGRISLRTRQAEISGSQFNFSFQPLTVTLLELTLGK